MPRVIPSTEFNGKHKDIYSQLLDNFTLFIDEEFTEDLASLIVPQLLYLQAKDPNKEITIYINSPGGSVHAGLAIYDTVRLIKNPVSTVVVGMAASMGAFSLSCLAMRGGKRRAAKHAQIMYHRVSAGARGNIQDMIVSLKHTEHLDELLAKLIADSADMDLEKYKKLSERDLWLTAEQAVEMGFVDEVL